MPAYNPTRRTALADAAVALLARDGVHGLTHRAVEAAAEVPTGTASNYFRTRDELLTAAAQRIGERHAQHIVSSEPRPASPPREPIESVLVQRLTNSVIRALTEQRDLYLALFELQLQARRSPTVANALAQMGRELTQVTAEHHDRLGIQLTKTQQQVLMTLYGGILQFAVTGASSPTASSIRPLVRAAVRGTLAAGS